MLDKFLIKDTRGEKSITATAFVVGFLIATAKLLISGITLGGLEMSQFTGVDYAAAVSALGGIYLLRRSTGGTDGK